MTALPTIGDRVEECYAEEFGHVIDVCESHRMVTIDWDNGGRSIETWDGPRIDYPQ